MHYPVGLLATLNGVVARLAQKLVPVVASKIRICEYDLRVPKTGPVGPTGPQSEAIGANVLTSEESATLEGEVERLPALLLGEFVVA
ncbi:MAG: hypothetical protein ACLPVY_22605 [Acidimicrobiia bacterium]